VLCEDLIASIEHIFKSTSNKQKVGG